MAVVPLTVGYLEVHVCEGNAERELGIESHRYALGGLFPIPCVTPLKKIIARMLFFFSQVKLQIYNEFLFAQISLFLY